VTWCGGSNSANREFAAGVSVGPSGFSVTLSESIGCATGCALPDGNGDGYLRVILVIKLTLKRTWTSTWLGPRWVHSQPTVECTSRLVKRSGKCCPE